MRLWDWAVDAWAKPGVEEAGLALQDVAGQNLPLLLWAAWAAAEGRALEADSFDDAADVARAWETSIVGRLRDLRRDLKGAIPDIEHQDRESIRVQVRAVELAAEQAQLAALEALAPDPGGKPLPVADALVLAAQAWGRATPRAELVALAAKLSA